MPFLKDIIPSFFVFFLGDILTTYCGLRAGLQEQNLLARMAYCSYGFEALILAKIAFFCGLYLLYKVATKRYWLAASRSVFCVGLYISVKNAMLLI